MIALALIGVPLPLKAEIYAGSTTSQYGLISEGCIPSGRKKADDCRDRNLSMNLTSVQANEMKRGSFDSIFNVYGLEPGVIGSIDVYSVIVDFV